MAELPSGTVTFLFTDVEGSTRLWEQHPDAMQGAMARHDAILREQVQAHGGTVVKKTGDGVHAAFPSASEAVLAALDAQIALEQENWGDVGSILVRMGIHSGDATYRDGDYYGAALNEAARLMSVGHGGQVLVSESVESLTRQSLPAGAGFVDIGVHHLRDVRDPVHVFQLTHPKLRAEFPPLRSLDAMPGNLPRQVTTFVGRRKEIEALAVLVLESPLVTLTGVGGVGKTRLALEVAAQVVDAFRDGAWLCEFAPVTDPGAVWETVAASLRVQPSQGRSFDEAVMEYLAPKRLLLVLDNCEHLLDAIARLVDALAHRCPQVSVLATSREGLALAGERIVAVPSLGVPARDDDLGELLTADAVQLFAERARAAKADFELNENNVAAVAVLCRRLDGIPLAIELAAARVRSMAPEDLVSRLDQRFKLLTRGSRAALERHQTLRSTIDWSYDLLDPIERHALECLSVFAGGCDLAAAEAVLGGDGLDAFDVPDVLGQLVDKSLVVADESGDRVRYRLLESIRQYAQEQLQEHGGTAHARRAHADHFVAVAEVAGPGLRGRDHVVWTDVVMRDVDNFRAALDWAVELPSIDHALRLVVQLAVQGLVGEIVMDWADLAITIPGAADDPRFPIVAAWAAWAATFRLDFDRAEELVETAEQAQAALGTRELPVVRARAALEFFRGDLPEARRHAEDWVRMARAASDTYELAHALVMLGGALQLADLVDQAIVVVDEAVLVARRGGIDNPLPFALTLLAGLLPPDEEARALALLDEAIELGDRVGARGSAANALGAKGAILLQQGEWRAALPHFAGAADRLLQLGDLAGLPPQFFGAAIGLGALGRLEGAAILIGRADAFGPRLQRGWTVDLLATTQELLLDTLGEREVAALVAQGSALELEEAVRFLQSEVERALREA